MTDFPFLIIGLGNPGREYAQTRHNVGFMLIDRLAVRLNAHGLKMQAKAIVTDARYGEQKILLAKPQTFMNLSGQAVQGLIHFYKLPLDHVLVAHDDLDLPFCTLRMRPGGGAGGQKGIKSTIDQLGTNEFARLRLGIDRPPGRMDPAAYVLQEFSPKELQAVSETLDRAADAAVAWVTEGLDAAMNKFNGDAGKPVDK
ncbi:MAG: aminoacyl-tRNA hydrolase [Anaerolineae bacterium CG_4_9_14_3_um_filter_57_17]|nr:aminoacyl-tRNA hydrolase [bacterium]NCT19692.1 aminoacyl-tRNA hydrolase [bacterium]OIO83576.1 MAG: aminoacyl-tRNA hydrolase [Anaerolineae bacterium CG2_30_57_67]PJB66746.1 MAG: aminoacyl-tRNA hydrolase [Anaerolineae bacterium CG_4_9_14_3_um_filter_57_17]